MQDSINIVIVSHDSSDVLDRCIAHLLTQTIPLTSIVIVDSGSQRTGYLDSFSNRDGISVIKIENRGFGRANNRGYREIADNGGVVIFLNPDTFLPPEYVADALKSLKENPHAAIVSGKLLGFDLEEGKGSGKIDSTGIFRKWYGRWYDRGQGETDRDLYNSLEDLPAVCGALMVCRSEALSRYNGEVFDKDFFLYKEDIELSLRLRRDGWTLHYDPRLVAYHCRGWQKTRGRIAFSLRIMAAKNELLLYKKHPSPYLAWALFKYLLVAVFRL